MSIKLKGSSDGSVSLDAPADTSPTGTDVTFVLPTKDGTGNQVLSTDGSGNLSFADNVSSGRNLVINAAMNVAQRGTSAVTASGAFPVDRFKTSYNVTGGGFSAQQSTDAPEGFKNSVKFTVTTAASAGSAEVSSFFTALEGQDVQQADLGLSTSKPLTLSFYVKSSLTGTYSVAMRNSDGSRSYIAEYSISSADTWEKKTVTFPAITSGTWATDNTEGLSLTWDLGSGSDRQGTAGSWLSGTNDFASTNNVNWCNTASATWFITGVQLEVGSVGTDFEHRRFADELASCLRYYQRITGNTGDQTMICPLTCHVVNAAGDDFRGVYTFPVKMRADAAMTFNDLLILRSSGDMAVIAGTSLDESTHSIGLDMDTGSTDPSLDQMAILRVKNLTTSYIDFSAEF